MNISGIYEILNTVNGKRYIGSAVKFSHRWAVHRSDFKLGVHGNKYFQRSWDKYGPSAFRFSILLFCSPENLIFYEQRAIDVFKPEYNLCKIAGSSLGYTHTSETREKLSIINTGRITSEEARKNLSKAGKGKKKPLEWRQRMSAIHTGKILSTEHVLHMSEALKGKPWTPARRVAQVNRSNLLSPLLGKPLSAEHASRISAALKGRKLSTEHVSHISEPLKGKPWSPARRIAQVNTNANQKQRRAKHNELELI